VPYTAVGTIAELRLSITALRDYMRGEIKHCLEATRNFISFHSRFAQKRWRGTERSACSNWSAEVGWGGRFYYQSVEASRRFSEAKSVMIWPGNRARDPPRSSRARAAFRGNNLFFTCEPSPRCRLVLGAKRVMYSAERRKRRDFAHPARLADQRSAIYIAMSVTKLDN
jgi:hypothetical protein